MGDPLEIDPSEVFANSDADSLRALAGPGTGKTFALVRRLARLLDDGVNPARTLVATFARTAARDLVAAVARMGEAGAEELVPRTLHSYCFSVLGRQRVLEATGRAPRIALDFERTLLLADLEGPFGTVTERKEVVLAFEAAWARQQTDNPGEPVEGLDQAFQDALLRSLRWHRAMLVGEVVPVALSYLRNNPQAEERQAFDVVLVDEYQDLNRAEQELLNLLSENGDIAVIGDDDQSIYGFKWANPEGIREFAGDHPGTEDVEFVICRRCPHRVVAMAQILIQRNPGRVRGALVNEARETDSDAWEVLRRLSEHEIHLPHTQTAVDRWGDLTLRLQALEPIRDDFPALVEALFPDGDPEVALLRETALGAADDAESLSQFASAVRYGASQREVPLEAAEVRVMSMHASKGLTADLVVLAGLVEGVLPRVNAQLSLDEQEAQRQEQRRLFFVGMTRTTNILAFSSYSQLDVATAHRLQAARGARIDRDNVRTFATSFLGELGAECPAPIRGEAWNY